MARAEGDDSAADALRGAGVVVGLSLAAVAVMWAVRRLSGGSGAWRRVTNETDNDRFDSANQEAPSAVPSTNVSGFGFANFVDGPRLGGNEELRDEEGEADESGEVLPADLVQLTTRRRLPGGQESIEQFVRCTFADSDPQSVVHVAFCPPLMTTPTLDVDQLEGPEATIKTTLAEVFGARLEVRLMGPAEQGTEVVLRIQAVG